MKIEICECNCHKKNEHVLHIVPCCRMSCAKYLNEDGSFDWIEVGKMMRKHNIKGDYNDKQ